MWTRRMFLAASAVIAPHLVFRDHAMAQASFPEALTDEADLVVYGATPGGITAAVEAASRGLKAIIVGGWRETHLGGMMSGGLSKTDYRDIDAFGGRPREFLRRVNHMRGRDEAVPRSQLEEFFWETGKYVTGVSAAGKVLGYAPPKREPYVFAPSEAERAFEDMVSDHGIPVYWSKGVDRVEMTGRRIRRFTTMDGQSFAGKVFVDGSYEGDLLARAGVRYEVGRGPTSPENPLDGFRYLDRSGTRDEDNQFFAGGHLLDVDPFGIPGNEASGLLPHVLPFPDTGFGAPDRTIQSYNFRMCMTNEPALRLDLSDTPPEGYAKADYEVLFRYLAAASEAGAPLGFADLFVLSPIGNGLFDINAKRGFSTDAVGLSWDYPEAGYASRERIWKQHESYTRGLFYALQWEDDSRVPAALRSEALAWGPAKDQFTRPHPNDEAGWPYQLYVREARRMVGALRWNDSDLNRLDGIAPRSSKIIALASYQEDSHQMQRLSLYDDARDAWTIWLEGSIQAEAGGHDRRSPLPLEIILPRREDCTNLMVTFCVSASHQAFSAIRMELCSMALGQAAGAAAALAVTAERQPDLQDTDYPALRALLNDGGQMMSERFPPHWTLEVGAGVAVIGALGVGVAMLRREKDGEAPSDDEKAMAGHRERSPAMKTGDAPAGRGLPPVA